MRGLILAVLVTWGCAEGVSPPRQFDKAADATGEKAATLVQAPVDREQADPQEEQEEQQEEEQEEAQMTSTPAESFDYEEWTAELPTRGRPLVPEPPFPYLEAGGKKEIFDRLRRLRWVVWEYEKSVRARDAWIKNWQKWERDGHVIRLAGRTDAKRICTEYSPTNKSYPLRANDQTLKVLLSEYRTAKSRLKQLADDRSWRDLSTAMWNLLSAYGDPAMRAWHQELDKLWASHQEAKKLISKSAMDMVLRIKRAIGCATFENDPFNACWIPPLWYAARWLREPRCEEQL